MQKAIYKIENKINHKIYIGQSNRPEKRFREHLTKKEGYSSLIHQAFVKYGIENFSFEILGWYDDYNEQEKYYIQKYKSLAPYGYNISPGGNEPPHGNGENNNNAKISQTTADNVIRQLLDWRIPRKTIISSNKITSDILRHINEGTSWKKQDLTYPLRPGEKVLNEYRADYIKWLCCSTTIPLNHIGALVGWNRSSAKMINNGTNHYDAELKYPIRENSEYNKNILSQKTCNDYLHFEE